MLSLTLPPIPIPIPIPTTTHLRRNHHHRFKKPSSSIIITLSSRLPSPPPSTPPPPGEIYQPFRPPPPPLPSKYSSLSPADRIEILRNRLGLWHEYAPLISALSHDGFTPSSIEDLTGISPLDQNRIAVSSSVRFSLPDDLLPFFDSPSSSELLYHLRLLSSRHRANAARYLVSLDNPDGAAAEDVARAMKDFPRRRGDDGWEFFSPDSPADCLAYTQFRLSREAIAVPEKLSALEKAIELVETAEAKERITREIEKVSGRATDADDEELKLEEVKLLQVVRLKYGEVAETATVVVLPASKAVDGAEGVKAAPGVCKWEGELGVVAAEKAWGRWVVLPGWAPVMGIGGEGGVAVEFGSSRGLPWRVRKWGDREGVVVVVDRKRKVVGGENGDGFYLASGKGEGEGGLRVERGSKLEEEEEVLGCVVMVVRLPKEEDDELSNEDWD